MPASVIAWMNAVQGLLLIAPNIEQFAGQVRQWIQDMFTAGLITAETQNLLMARVDEICAAILAGQELDSWKVDPDPV